MGWRFRKRINIAPGVKINLSKSGISTTFGGKWGSVNVGKNGTYLNTGIRGTGFYRRDRIDSGNFMGSTIQENYYYREEPIVRFGNNWGCFSLGCGIILLLLIIWMALGIYGGIGVWANDEGAKDALFGFGILTAITLARPIILYIKRIWKKHKLEPEIKTSMVNPLITDENKVKISYLESLKNTNLDYYKNIINYRVSSIKYDSHFVDAAYLIVDNQLGSTSLLQRELVIGYKRAGIIMDQLEEAGIVGAPKGSLPRDVLIPNIQELDNYFSKLLEIGSS